MTSGSPLTENDVFSIHDKWDDVIPKGAVLSALQLLREKIKNLPSSKMTDNKATSLTSVLKLIDECFPISTGRKG